MNDRRMSIQLSKHARFILAGTLLAVSSANVLAEQKVPSHTYFQARKVVLSEYPQASNLQIERYSSDSINGLVGKVLNASTVIRFELSGQAHEVIMLPDGQHLLLGSIIKAGTEPGDGVTPSQASVIKQAGRDSRASLDAIERNHKDPLAEGTLPKLKLDLSNGVDDLVKQSRMVAADLEPVFEGAAKTPDAFMSVLEKLPNIQTGSGDNHIYIFFDPNCPNCRLEYQSSLKHQEAAVFHWIPIYSLTTQPTYKQVALSQSSESQNAENLALLMVNPEAKDGLEFEVSEEAARRLQETQKAFYNLADRRTPVTLYRSANGTPVRITGYNPKLISSILKDMKSPG